MPHIQALLLSSQFLSAEAFLSEVEVVEKRERASDRGGFMDFYQISFFPFLPARKLGKLRKAFVKCMQNKHGWSTSCMSI
jgi:hypothetical protein